MGFSLSSEWRRGIAIAVAVLTLVVGVLVVWRGYISHTSDRVYFSVTEFSVPQLDSLTVGENSDICWKGIPKDYMTVKYDKATNKYSYTISKTDSCCYYKINNHNPNRHTIDSNSKIVCCEVELSGSDITNMLDAFDNHYYALSDVLLKHDASLKSKIDECSDAGEPINSIIYRKGKKGDDYDLLILDKHTTVDGKKFCYSDTVDGDELKIQFYTVSRWSLLTDYTKEGKKYFNDGLQTYYAKSTQLYTEWGAGHVKVNCNNDRFSVSFPKAITIAIPIAEIEKASSRLGIGVYLKQSFNSYPLSSDFYIPAFSNALPEEICELSTDKWLCFQRSNARDTVQLNESLSFFPSIDVRQQELATGSITYKSRVLNKSFYWSKHAMLCLVWFVLLLILLLLFPKKGAGDAVSVKWYIGCMFTLFYYYLNQKLIIGEKLSYTYPYFEKMFPVVYLATLFSLCALFLLIIILNAAFFKLKNYGENGFGPEDYCFGKKNATTRYKRWHGCLIGFGVLSVLVGCLLATCEIYSAFISPIWNSYLASDQSPLKLLKVFQSDQSPLFNDNHFIVPIVVFALIIVLAIIALVALCKRLKKGKLRQRIEKGSCWVRFLLDVIGLAISLICCRIIPGNFATAIAVFGMILLVGEFMFMLSQCSPKKEVWKRVGLIILCGVLCVVSAGPGLAADMGFFINMFGIAIAWLVLVPLVMHSDGYRRQDTQKVNRKSIRCVYIFVLLAVVVVAMCLKYGGANSNDYEKVDYSRSSRRFHNVIAPEKVKEVGYSYTESDMQWMEDLRFYAEKVAANDSISGDIYGEENSFHRLLATGISPVVLNDASVPAAYLGPLRKWGLFGLLCGLIAMGVVAFVFSIVQYVYGDTTDFKKDNKKENMIFLSRRQIWRLVAASVWILESVYLLASYYWMVPFTGRLIPGFGVDAVGEALEILVLFAFMCSMSEYYSENEKINRKD